MSQGLRLRPMLELTVAAAAALLGTAAHAQTPAPDAGLERAQKAADAVFHWIKLNGEKGANRQPPAPAPAPAPRKPAPVAAAPKPAPTPAARTAPATADAPAPVAAVMPEPQAAPDSAPALLATAAPTAMPDTPLALAAEEVPPPPAVEEEVPLKLLSRVNPIFPRQLMRESLRDGFARVKFMVAPDGSVSKVETIRASHARLGTAAVEAVRQWRFAPIPAAREAGVEFAFNNTDE